MHRISRKGLEKIQKIYNVPFFKILSKEDVPQLENFKKFSLLRKQLHLMFDSICQPEMLLEVFADHENLLLKDIQLSLRDFEEISNRKLVDILEIEIDKFDQHFTTCEVSSKEMLQTRPYMHGML